MNCCGNCFGDHFLAGMISNMSASTGTCSYCHANGVDIISPEELFLTFDGLRDVMYVESTEASAVPLSQLLRSDWRLFHSLTHGASDALLKAILPDSNTVHFEPVVAHDSSAVSEWDQFRNELLHENRYFPQTKTFDAENEGQLFNYLAVGEAESTRFYRARLKTEESPFSLDKMGRPPNRKVSYGRANPIGISYLYVATDEETAIAEIRPHKDATVCVATFELTDTLKFADLCDPRSRISPFLLIAADDDEGLRSLRKSMPFLERMGDELSKPVSPDNSHLEYLPSQYLCEFLKHSGFHGVVYNSSVGAGKNYALFDDDCVNGIEVRLFHVDDVTHKTSLLA